MNLIEKIQAEIQDKIRQEIMNNIKTEFPDKPSGDIISDLNEMIVRTTTVIVCSKNDKITLEECQLPKTVKIIPTKYLEDGTVLMIKDENIKKQLLESEIKSCFLDKAQDMGEQR